MQRIRRSAVAVFALGLSLPAAGQEVGPSGQETPVRKGRVELSTAASFSSWSAQDGDDSFDTLNIPLRVGLLVTRRLELEAEGQLSTVSSGLGSQTGYQLGAHALYHLGDRRVVPFVLAGAGIGDSVDVLGLTLGDDDADPLSVTTLRAGGGVKVFAGDRAAFRFEYRFTHYVTKVDDPFGVEEDYEANQHRLFVGISVFFR